MAFATSASAGTIIWSGIQDVTAGPIASAQNSNRVASQQNIILINGVRFQIGVDQALGDGFKNGGAYLHGGFFTNAFLDTNVGSFARKLAAGSRISGGAGRFGNEGIVASQNSFTQQFDAIKAAPLGQFQPNSTGFVGFAFKTQAGTSATSFAKATGAQTDYGWIQVKFTEGQNGLSNSLEAIDWAYDTSGNAITAGAGASTPEPGTGALALLAAGAAGILALRRRKARLAQ